MSFQAFINNDNAVTVAGLKNVCTGDFANAAIVTITVTDKNGVEVPFDNTADAWPRPLNYVTGSNGNYCGVIPLEAVLVPKSKYIAVIIATEAGVRARWNLHFTAAHRNVSR